MMLKVGLTGSIGMGKSTTARMFCAEGFPVWDADDAVRRLYASGGGAVAKIAGMWPEAIRDGAVDRAALKRRIAADPQALAQIEALVHPLVAADRESFCAAAVAPAVILDIPLLFETGGDAAMDRIVVVTAPREVQERRVLERPGMTQAQFELILSRQMPDADKRARADYVVETLTLPEAERQVRRIADALRKDARHA